MTRTKRLILFRSFWVLSFTGFFSIVSQRLWLGDLRTLLSYTLGYLAALYGSASLFYNRSRSIDDPRQRLRSIYAAERCTQAFLIACAGIGVLIGISAFVPSDRAVMIAADNHNLTVLLTFLPLGLISYSFVCASIGLSSLAKRFMKWQWPRQFLKPVRPRN